MDWFKSLSLSLPLPVLWIEGTSRYFNAVDVKGCGHPNAWGAQIAVQKKKQK